MTTTYQRTHRFSHLSMSEVEESGLQRRTGGEMNGVLLAKFAKAGSWKVTLEQCDTTMF